jgi:hypothetical protein
MSSRSWRDVARETQERNRQRAAEELTTRPASQPVYIPGTPEPVQEQTEVVVDGGTLQAFVFTPNMQPRSHRVIIRLNTTSQWNLAMQCLTALRERKQGPLEIELVGQLEDVTTALEAAENADNADDPSHGAPV